MVFRISCGFDEFLYDVRRRRVIGVPHAEVDNILARLPCLELERLDFIKDIGRQPIDSEESVIWLHDCCELTKCGDPRTPDRSTRVGRFYAQDG